MDYSNIRVLLPDGGSRQILPIIYGLHDLGCKITTINSSKLDNGYASKYPDKRILCKPDECLLDVIGKEAATGAYDVLFALSDGSTDLITRNLEELSQYIRIPIPSRDTFMKAYNKQNTMRICMENHIPCPITKMEGESLDDFMDKVSFPIIAKPRQACGSMGLKIVHGGKDLARLIGEGSVVLDQYVIQELVPLSDKQYNVHLFVDDEGAVKLNFVTEKCRWFPLDGGASCMCRTVNNQFIVDICSALMNAVKWRGYCDVDLIVDPRDGIPKVLEINGRISANLKITYLSGVNVARQLLELAYGVNVEEYKKYGEDIRMRCLHTDTLWFIMSPNRFTARPSWFSRRNTHDQIFSIADPLPFFAFTLKMVPRYFSEMKKRSRQ